MLAIHVFFGAWTYGLIARYGSEQAWERCVIAGVGIMHILGAVMYESQSFRGILGIKDEQEREHALRMHAENFREAWLLFTPIIVLVWAVMVCVDLLKYTGRLWRK